MKIWLLRCSIIFGEKRERGEVVRITNNDRLGLVNVSGGRFCIRKFALVMIVLVGFLKRSNLHSCDAMSDNALSVNLSHRC